MKKRALSESDLKSLALSMNEKYCLGLSFAEIMGLQIEYAKLESDKWGQCVAYKGSRSCLIQISEELRNTSRHKVGVILWHELCHVKVQDVDHMKSGHGPIFRSNLRKRPFQRLFEIFFV